VAEIPAYYADDTRPFVPTSIPEQARYAQQMEALLNEEFPANQTSAANQRLRNLTETTVRAYHELWQAHRNAGRSLPPPDEHRLLRKCIDMHRRACKDSLSPVETLIERMVERELYLRVVAKGTSKAI
jgi:hypothetical protein